MNEIDWSNKEEVLAAVSGGHYGEPLQYASEELRGDKEVVLAAVSKNGESLEYASEELRGDKEVVLAALRGDYGGLLQYASEELRGDKEVVLAAVKNDWRALEYASEELREDKEVIVTCVELLENELYWIEFYGIEYQDDEDRLIEVTEKEKELLGKANKEVVIEIVKKHGHLLEYASEELRGDREVVLAAVKNNRHSLEFASKELRADEEVIQMCIEAEERSLKAVMELVEKGEMQEEYIAITQETIEYYKNKLAEIQKGEHTPSEIAEGIEPTQSGMDEVTEEMIAAQSEKTTEHEKPEEKPGEEPGDN